MRGREEGQLPQGGGGESDPESRAAGIPGAGDHRSAPARGLWYRAGVPGLTWSRAGPRAAAAQVARAGWRRRLLPQPWAAGGVCVEGGVALKGAGTTGVGTNARVRRSRRIRWGRGKRVASPRGQNQEGSQMEEEKRSQEEETNFSGEVGEGGGSELEDLGRAPPALSGLRQRSLHKGGPGRQ